MTTVRSHDQFNSTIYAWNDVYRGVHNERRVLFLNPNDMAARDLAEGDVVNITGHYKGQKCYAKRLVAVPINCWKAIVPITSRT